MNIFVVGIGGIGVSALAQLYAAHGESVSGSDRTESPVTDLLRAKGIPVTIGHSADNVPANADVVVYSDAVPYDSPERVRARELGVPEQSYFEALGQASQGVATIAVTGTHGKTTTTAMLAKILKDAGKNPTAIIGSMVKDFGSNFVDGSSDLLVVEACEYKDHVLELEPKVLVITNIEWDHTDYFVTEADLLRTFNEAARKVPAGGAIVADPSLPHMDAVLAGVVAPVIDYTKEDVPKLALLGAFNEMNARAARAAALVLFPDLNDAETAKSLQTFQGTWRRFEYKGKTKSGVPVYDDYAHHPTAIRVTLEGARAKFPNKKIALVFHPHLYSRTRDLFDGFVEELAKADMVILAPIFAAREVDDGSVSSDLLAAAIAKINPNVKSLPDFDSIIYELGTINHELLITMGAGDIYKVADRIVA